MPATPSHLTDTDVRLLARRESPSTRAHAARKICLRIAEGGLAPEARNAADEVVRIIAGDEAAVVRCALSETLKASPNLPHDVAARLARDLDGIAAPVLERSPVLGEDDLIAVARAGSPPKQAAIARRDHVPLSVAAAVVDHGGEGAVAALARNDGADIDPAAMESALLRFGEGAVTDALIARLVLPPLIAGRLAAMVSHESLQRLARRHALPPQLAVELHDRGAIDVLDQAGCAGDMRRLVQQLQLNGLLSATLVVRGLCLGRMRFFEHAVAELAGMPHGKAWVLVHDAGPLGLRAVFERTGMPARLFAPIRAAVDIHEEIEREGAARAREHASRTMLERLLSRSIGLSAEDADYLLAKLDALEAGDGEAWDVADSQGAGEADHARLAS